LIIIFLNLLEMYSKEQASLLYETLKNKEDEL
jgi:hypothetical protein